MWRPELLINPPRDQNEARHISTELADNPTTEDLLGFDRLAETLALVVSKNTPQRSRSHFSFLSPRLQRRQSTQSSSDTRSGITIGIYGEWGSGKTSFLRMIENKLKHHQIHTIWFDAWKYDREENLWAALLQNILNQVGNHGPWYRRILLQLRLWRDEFKLRNGLWEVFRKLLGLAVRLVLVTAGIYLFSLNNDTLTTLLDPWQSAGLPIPAISFLIKSLSLLISVTALDPFKLFELIFQGKLNIDYAQFRKRVSYREHIAFVDDFKLEFQQIIYRLDQHKPLVVIIDDLDRCLPERSIQVLEAIKAFLDIEGCVFLLALDKEMIQRSVAAKFRELMIAEDGQEELFKTRTLFYEEYMDKIIQLAISLPRLPANQIEHFVKRLSVDRDIQRCAAIFGVGLPPNPRKIKRVLRAFLFIRDMISADITHHDEIKPSLIAKLIVLQHQFPYVYEAITEQPALLQDLERFYSRGDGTESSSPSGRLLKEDWDFVRDPKYTLDRLKIRHIFTCQIDENDSFIGVSLNRYIALIGTLAVVRSLLTEKTEGTVTLQTRIEPIWNVPYPHNPYFTGRESFLTLLYDKFLSVSSAPSIPIKVAISGLGGLGKTQVAVEYAYRYRDTYQAILWVTAASSTTLTNDFIAIATHLRLPERAIHDQIEAVKQWLVDHPRWLLILDDANNLEMVKTFLPTRGEGHILLTTQAQITGTIADVIRLDRLDLEAGILFLLRRSKRLDIEASLNQVSEEEQALARAIIEAIDGHPLAIEQAGAYIESRQCNLAEYLELFQKYSSELLLSEHQPANLSATIFSSFSRVEQANPAAADLLRLCAFLHPEAIPEEILTEGASKLGPTLTGIAQEPLNLNAALQVLLIFSLLHRNPDTQQYNVHRLVQTIMREKMSEDERRTWAERAIRAINHLFPEVESATWERCERLLPQTRTCTELISFYDFTFEDAIQLLEKAGAYLLERSQSIQAEQFYQQVLAIRKQTLGSAHPDVADSLNNLALVYHTQENFAQAEPLYREALALREQILGPEHLDIAQSLHNLAGLYQIQGNAERAEYYYRQALSMRQKILQGPHPSIAITLDNLARLFQAQNQLDEAERYYIQAQEIYQQLPTTHPELSEATPLDAATNLNNLATLYQVRQQYEKAETCYRQALSLLQALPGPGHPNLASILDNLAGLFRELSQYEQARHYYEQAIKIFSELPGPRHPGWATTLNNLAGVCKLQGTYEQAETYYLQAIKMYEELFGLEQPGLADILENYTTLLWDTQRTEEALQQEARVREIRLHARARN